MSKNTLVIALVGLFVGSFSCSSCNEPKAPITSVSGSGGSVVHNNNTSDVTSETIIASSSSGTEEQLCDPAQTGSCEPVNPDSLITEELVKGSGWQISVPLSWRIRNPVQKNVVLSRESDNPKLLLVLLQEPFTGSYEQYTLSSVRAYKEGGATVSSSKEVDLNGTKSTLLEVVKNGVKIWNWITIKDNFGYVLSCGGPAPYELVSTPCSSVVSKFTFVSTR